MNRISSDDSQENNFLNLQDVPLFDRAPSQACEIKAPKFHNALRKSNSIVKENLLVPPAKSCHGCSSLSVWTGPDLDDGTISVNTFFDSGSESQCTILGGLWTKKLGLQKKVSIMSDKDQPEPDDKAKQTNPAPAKLKPKLQ